jgi:hypothetical protein
MQSRKRASDPDVAPSGLIHLRYIEIQAILQAGTLTDAASLLNISQPAATKLLKQAERRLGFPLFVRVKGQWHLTPESHLLKGQIESFSQTREGSDYARMLDAALEGFGDVSDRDRYLIVLSDGESSTRSWEKRLADLSKRQIHVVALGVGAEKGGFIPDQQGGYMADKNGDAVLSRLMPATLWTLANRTNGKYLDTTTLKSIDDVRAVRAHFDSQAGKPATPLSRIRARQAGAPRTRFWRFPGRISLTS